MIIIFSNFVVPASLAVPHPELNHLSFDSIRFELRI